MINNTLVEQVTNLIILDVSWTALTEQQFQQIKSFEMRFLRLVASYSRIGKTRSLHIRQ
jgi:hypothetical protein